MDESPFLLLPEGMFVEQIQMAQSQLTVLVRSTSEASCCPGCGCPSEHVPSAFSRDLFLDG